MEQVRQDGVCRIQQKNKFSVGETLEVMKPDGRNLETTVRSITDGEGRPMESAPHPRQELYVELDVPVEVYDILRKETLEK